ncbi:MAG: alpha/beta hydrolase family protein [Chthonomonadales bacterium]
MNCTVMEYLVRRAREITRCAGGWVNEAADLSEAIRRRREEFLDALGIAEYLGSGDRPAPPWTVTGDLERPGYRIRKLWYESIPGLYVTANLYLPDTPAVGSGAPAVLYLCGHAPHQKTYYQAIPRRFAQMGFAALIVETVQLGEVEGYHHGCFREGWFHWYSRGYSPAAVELLNAIRGLDLLANYPGIDGKRLGATGISGGGATTWWVAAADERVAAAAPVCGTATLASHIAQRTLDGHCDCMWWPNTMMWDLADVGALVAPRPLLIASADRDGIFTAAGIRMVHRQLVAAYRRMGVPNHLRLVLTPGPHGYHRRSRTEVFSWMMRHLADRDIPPGRVGDVDEAPDHQEPAEVLRVYVSGEPAGNRVRTIQDELVPTAAPPMISDLVSLTRERDRVTQRLRERPFRWFPSPPPALAARWELRHAEGEGGGRFSFLAEAGWRLQGVYGRVRGALGLVVALRSHGEGANDAEEFARSIRADADWALVEPRGTGDTAWGDELNWRVRRAAAWTGVTTASWQVWDVLRALEALQALTGWSSDRTVLVARGSMAVPALYAALLHGRLGGVVLQTPPSTLDAPSSPDGRGPAVEVLGALRIADLEHVAALLAPAELVLVDAEARSYSFAEEAYRTVGAGKHFRRAASLEDARLAEHWGAWSV